LTRQVKLQVFQQFKDSFVAATRKRPIYVATDSGCRFALNRRR